MKGMCHLCYSQSVKVTLTEVKSKVQTITENTKIPLCERCREKSTPMKGLCQKCYASGVEVRLTEIAKNDVGISEIPLVISVETSNLFKLG